MKVLHLLQSNRFSGAENVVCQIIETAKKRSGPKMIYCSPDGQIREALKERNIDFVPIKELSVKEIQRVIKEQKPDVIHAHDRTACFSAARAERNIPIIAHIHVNNNSGLGSFVKNTAWTLVSKRYRRVFWVSQSCYESFQYKAFVKKKSRVLYNVIDIENLEKKAAADENSYDYDIAYVGRLSYQKNPERLMRVLHGVVKENPTARAAIVGSGDYESCVKEYIKNNNLEENISYLGYMNNPLKLIQSARVLVMTSYFEGTPMTALEAKCLGVPVVSTPVDGLKKIIKNGYCGYLSDKDEELVGNISKILNDDTLYGELSRNSRRDAEEYNDINDFYAEILSAYVGGEDKR